MRHTRELTAVAAICALTCTPMAALASMGRTCEAPATALQKFSVSSIRSLCDDEHDRFGRGVKLEEIPITILMHNGSGEDAHDKSGSSRSTSLGAWVDFLGWRRFDDHDDDDHRHPGRHRGWSGWKGWKHWKDWRDHDWHYPDEEVTPTPLPGGLALLGSGLLGLLGLARRRAGTH